MRVLLIMPRFFDYPKQISEELKLLGYEVDYFDDRPSTRGLIKAIIRINKNMIYTYIKKYFKEIMAVVRNQKYDIVLLISGQSLSFDSSMIEAIKEAQPKAKFILYQWDSLRNFPYIKSVSKYFDHCYSFDNKDVSTNEYLDFLPLFYIRRYQNIGNQLQKKSKYDCCFIGTAHPKKYKFIRMMSEQLREIYPNQFIYFFFPSKLVYFYRKLKNSELKNAHLHEFHYAPLSGNDMAQIIAQSRCILDSAQDGQTGLTIRSLEALGSKKKLITTNQNIKNYDFYRAENVYIYDGTFDFSSPFFQAPYQELPEELYHRYSLNYWLKTLLLS